MSHLTASVLMQVPLDPRSFWRQRLRWAKGGHLYVLDPAAVIWAKSPHMSLYHKFLYCFPVCHRAYNSIECFNHSLLE